MRTLPTIHAALLAALLLAAAPRPAAAADDTVRLDDFARSYAFRIAYAGRLATLTNRYHAFRFELNSRRCEYRGVALWLSQPVTLSRGRWLLAATDCDKTLYPLLNPNRTLKAEDFQRVVLDPGHGGEDQGASGRSRWSTEKRLNLDLALRVQALLAPAFNVSLTRTSDKAVSLEDRCELARKLKADLFVSIHLNASTVTSAAGLETHILTPQGEPSTASSSGSSSDAIRYPGHAHDGPNMVLGYMLQRHLLLRTGAEDRGVRRSRFFVIRNMPCPAALVECGFLSNRAEESRLLSSKHRDALARGLADAITAYLNAVKRARVTGK